MEELEDIECTQAISRILKNLDSMIKCTSINLFLVDKNGDNLKNYLSNENDIFCENTNINIDYTKFSKLYK